ncbi:MAG: PEP-CTERM sorting domain-containing protein [Burkholderiaceae bacterium]
MGLKSAFVVLRRILAVVLIGCSGVASAAMVSFNDVALDGIFSQASFGGYNIDIRFNSPLSVVAPSLLSIDSNEEFSGPAPSLSALANQLQIPNFTVSLFYVDQISFCGATGSNIIGCGSSGGGLIALKSAAAAGTNGAALLAHELGHNLGLDHLSSSENLMNSSITGATLLTTTQVGKFLNLSTGQPINPIVQNDNGQLYISITPIAVLAAVPEPQTWAMLCLGLVGIAAWARRRRAWAG